MRPLIIGTRGSALALRQTQIVVESLQAALPGIEIETRTVHTEGDRRTDVSLEAFGGQGVFVKDIERGLLSGTLDLAVHSLKDMPAETPAGLTIGAVLPRADVRDALVSRGNLALNGLPEGARVGTDSKRRSVQLLALRPDLRVKSVRGNVDTRVHKAESGELEAVVLAVAGLERLGLGARIAQTFEVEEMLPAVGQGVLAVEARADDAELLDLLSQIDDEPTRIAMTAERAYLQRLGAGCRLPVGAFAAIEEGMLRLSGLLANDAGRVYHHELVGQPDDALTMGNALADWLRREAEGA